MTITEQVAMAIAEIDGGINSWAVLAEHSRNRYRGLASAAIRTVLAAIREPTPEMIDAGTAALEGALDAGGPHDLTSIPVAAAWQAALDAVKVEW